MSNWAEIPRRIVKFDEESKQWVEEIWIEKCCISRTMQDEKPAPNENPCVVFPENRWRLCSDGKFEIEAGNNLATIPSNSFCAVSANSWTHGSGTMARVVLRGGKRSSLDNFLFDAPAAKEIRDEEAKKAVAANAQSASNYKPLLGGAGIIKAARIKRPYSRTRHAYSAAKYWRNNPGPW